MRASIVIRRGQPDEAEALAKLHVDVWRATYGSLAPEEARTALDETKRLPYWVGALTLRESGLGVWVAEADRTIKGVVSVGISEHEAFKSRAEIKHLYVARGAQGQGIGERLLRVALEEGNAASPAGLALAVVRQNQLARKFYKKMGGVEIAEFIDPGPLWRSENILVAWDSN